MEKMTTQKKLTIIICSLLAVLICLVSVVIFTLNKKPEIATKAPIQIVNPGDINQLPKDYYGVLVLGSDQGATKTNGGNHTDSVTYVAINKKTNKAFALPIYRDAFTAVACDPGVSKNINHIYRDYGADCLKESVANLIGLQVDYQIYITSNGFVDFFNTLGPLSITPEASYCSKFGNDDIDYCFTEGQTQELNGNALLAYTRYRGNTSGEMRANRHIQVLNKAFEKCLANSVTCGAAVLTAYKNGSIQTDLPFEEVLRLKTPIQLENLGVIGGSNFQDDSGWHQRIDTGDLEAKTLRIKQEIFTS